MRFHVDHRFAWPIEAVMGAMVDFELYRDLELPGVGPPELLERASTGSRSRIELRYAFVGRLDPVARRVIGTDRLHWSQVIELDRGARTGRLRFVSEDPSHRLRGEAEITFDHDGGATTRTIDGELAVAVRLVAGRAERSIVDGLLGRLDLEAAAIRRRLSLP